jgi:predicted SAM-dependent methyltransferase
VGQVVDKNGRAWPQPVRLDLGSGPFPRGAGWIAVDAYVDECDLKAPMWDLPFDDGAVDAIYSSHSLEHVTKFQVPPTLAEWRRVLRPGGTAEVIVPDLRWACRNWLQHQTTDWHMDVVFGLQTHDGEAHRTGFTPKILQAYLADAGFEVRDLGIVWSHDQDSVRALAVRP